MTSADFYEYRLWGLGVAGGGEILGFSIDLRRCHYDTRTTVQVCDMRKWPTYLLDHIQ